MGIKKQEFYEGAAIHLLARSGNISSLRYDPPFFTLNNDIVVLLKYCTKGRSPWGFTFTRDEQALLKTRHPGRKIVIGLVCGDDGVAAFTYEEYLSIVPARDCAVHIACYRRLGEHYQINGPEGTLNWKIPPSAWRRILEQ